MNSCELVSAVTAIACAIAKCVPEEDLPIISAVFGELSSTLATISVHEEACEKKKPNKETDSESAIITIPPSSTLPQMNQ